MPEYDRLSALMNRFTLHVTPSAPDRANLLILRDADRADRILFSPHEAGMIHGRAGQEVLFGASVDWGGADNPLFASLPNRVDQEVRDDPDLEALVQVLCTEYAAQRCGVASVLDRVAEIVLVKLMRTLIERGTVQTGVLGGLSDKRLSRAIVALHDAPGRAWTNADMARVAGLSVSRFSELFRSSVGITPSAYLRRWRLVLARQDIARGDRIEAVARRYGYGSSEALNHMFRRISGETPIQSRRT